MFFWGKAPSPIPVRIRAAAITSAGSMRSPKKISEPPMPTTGVISRLREVVVAGRLLLIMAMAQYAKAVAGTPQ